MDSLSGGVYEAENVIEDVVRSINGLELEGLGEAHGFVLSVYLLYCQHQGYSWWIYPTHLQRTGNQHQDGSGSKVCRLSVDRVGAVLHLLEGEILYTLAF
jgi:hypothetical protein